MPRMLTLQLLVGIALFATTALGQSRDMPKTLPKDAGLIKLGKVNGESDEKITVVNIRFDGKPDWSNPPELENHGSFLQLILPRVHVPKPGTFYEGNSPFVKKIAVFQHTAKDAAIRLFVTNSASRTAKAAKAELLGKRVVVTIDHDKLEAMLAKLDTPSVSKTNKSETTAATQSTQSKAPSDARQEAEEIIAKADLEEASPSPASRIKGTDSAAASGFDFRGKLVQVAGFLGVFLLMALAALALRPWLRKRGAKIGAPVTEVSMKTLATLPLAPKQRLSLIEVGGQKILIGITPDHINFISNVDGESGATPALAALGAGASQMMLGQSQQQAFQQIMQDKSLDQAEVKLKAAPTPAPRGAAIDRRTIGARAGNRQAVEIAKSEPAKVTGASRNSPAASNRSKGQRLNIAIGDDGIDREASQPAETEDQTPASPKAVEDVTRLIREKLKNLKTL